MDYSRFNYVAQPEDGIDPADLIPKIGPYDTWATRWGYAPIPGAGSPDDELPTLDAWARQQDRTPWYRFSTAQAGGSDPHSQTEAVGDANAVEATTLGLRNLERVAGMLLEATTTQTGDPYSELREVYGRLVAQWTLEMNHVAALVGGFLSQQRHIGQDGVRFTPVPRARQAEAVQFLLANALTTPDFLIRPEIVRRIEPTGTSDRIANAQTSVLSLLLQTSRLERLLEQAALDDEAYEPVQYLADLREGIWRELGTPAEAIDPFRRNTQLAYLATVDNRLNGAATPDPAVRGLLRGELRTLRTQLESALPSIRDRATRLHVEDARDQIDEMLDPRAMRARATGGRGGADGLAGEGGLLTGGGFDFDGDPFLLAPDTCWPDYVVR
jgi:hypothetical protein